ncbi:Hsp20/alpha crystallin family protein [Desulforhopalus singaporensis]|uniref:Molecular chaperone IbpA, HSP20 family n=1 Tax=Desulforhopalus singaporensis TaxID=91360 RepID=A0A1H0T6P1_9BACT|nr:Hsp20/alpha crystallin family protein [Desulforhopalus singaporensis]SDP49644.1 Molecular chaperone IbpA, HSP20 family [Desulforhopalus singaporensis]
MSEKKDLVTREETMPERSRELSIVAPLVDIYENDEEILLHADMPGVKKEEITVNIDNGRLEITGLKKINKEGVAAWEEFGDAEYRRVFSVPQTIDAGKVKAELSDGVLKLHLPKAAAARPRKIEIRTA